MCVRTTEKSNVLILLFTCGGTAPAFLLAKALVVENVLDAAGCTAAVIGPVVVLLLVTASLQTLLMAGRVEVCERGILKTFARDARTGERDFMVELEFGGLNWTAGLIWWFCLYRSLFQMRYS